MDTVAHGGISVPEPSLTSYFPGNSSSLGGAPSPMGVTSQVSSLGRLPDPPDIGPVAWSLG